jgi:hypothetical protein
VPAYRGQIALGQREPCLVEIVAVHGVNVSRPQSQRGIEKRVGERTLSGA